MSEPRSASARQHPRLPRLALAVAAALGLSLGGAASAEMWRAGANPAEADRAAAEQTKLSLKDSPYGRVIFANGYAMYVFTKDKGSKSRCYGKCAAAWPPLAAKGEILAGAGVRENLIGMRKRRNGTRQLTYDGRPLYGYVHDPRGAVLCHDVEEFGGIWHAVRKSGKPAP